MSLRPTARARRIAEPGLLAAVAAVLHLADFFLAAGMLGSVLCPLPHAMSTLRHGLRAGILGALAAVCTVLLVGGLPEAGWHLFLFVVPGVAAGWALGSEGPLPRVLLAGTVACALASAGTVYVLERLMGVPESLPLVGGQVVWLQDLAATPLRWTGDDPAALNRIPGLVAPDVRAQELARLLEFPAGIFLAMGFILFLTTWFLAALLAIRLPGLLGETPGRTLRLPPLKLAPRLPLSVAVLFLTTYWAVPDGPAWVEVARLNLQVVLGLVVYLCGYMNLLAAGRRTPGGALFAILVAMPFYYVTMWLGLLSALQRRSDTQGDGPQEPNARE
jgi:hypothetical protein